MKIAGYAFASPYALRNESLICKRSVITRSGRVVEKESTKRGVQYGETIDEHMARCGPKSVSAIANRCAYVYVYMGNGVGNGVGVCLSRSRGCERREGKG